MNAAGAAGHPDGDQSHLHGERGHAHAHDADADNAHARAEGKPAPTQTPPPGASHAPLDREPAAAQAHAHEHEPTAAQAHAHEREPAAADAHGHDHEHANGSHHHDGGHAHTRLWSRLEHFAQPHSHDPADSVDSVLVGSSAGIRAVQLSLVGLGLTAALQLAIALTSGSVAVLADTIHNFADASTAIPLWLAFALGTRPASRRYTYGYGRAEDLAGVFVLLMIVGSAAIAFWESLQRLFHPTPVDHVGWVAAAGLVGLLGNELVAQYRIRVGTRIGSAALVADGYHARTDGLTSLAVVVGAAGVWLGFPIADPIVGLAITVAILLVLKDSAVQMWRRLMDVVDPALVEQATTAAAAAAGVERVSSVRARWIGHTIHAEALIVADGRISLEQAHAIAERARHAMLHAVPRLTNVTVHVDPSEQSGLDYHAELAHHDRLSLTR